MTIPETVKQPLKYKCDVTFPPGTPVNVYDESMNQLGLGMAQDWDHVWDYDHTNKPKFNFQVQLTGSFYESTRTTITVKQSQLAFANGCPISVDFYEGKKDDTLQHGKVVSTKTGLYNGTCVVLYYRVELSELSDTCTVSTSTDNLAASKKSKYKQVKCIPKHVFYRHTPTPTSDQIPLANNAPKEETTIKTMPDVYLHSIPPIKDETSTSLFDSGSSSFNTSNRLLAKKTTHDKIASILYILKHYEFLFDKTTDATARQHELLLPHTISECASATSSSISMLPMIYPTKQEEEQEEQEEDVKSVDTNTDADTIPDNEFFEKECFTWPARGSVKHHTLALGEKQDEVYNDNSSNLKELSRKPIETSHNDDATAKRTGQDIHDEKTHKDITCPSNGQVETVIDIRSPLDVRSALSTSSNEDTSPCDHGLSTVATMNNSINSTLIIEPAPAVPSLPLSNKRKMSNSQKLPLKKRKAHKLSTHPHQVFHGGDLKLPRGAPARNTSFAFSQNKNKEHRISLARSHDEMFEKNKELLARSKLKGVVLFPD